MTMHLAPEFAITCDAQLMRADLPLVVEFTSSRVRQRPLAARPGGIELAGAIRRALDPSMVMVDEPPRARALWNDFSTRLWGFTVR